jgi:hypothetical protein
MIDSAALSVDLEPNKDDTMDGVRDAMEWFDQTVPRGTIFATHRIATEMPDLLAMLAEPHEIGVHVHPREFGHERDQLAELDAARQREVISETRGAVADAVGVDASEITVFRAGRHSASEATLDVLAGLGFDVDASINVRYTDYLPASLTERRGPFSTDAGLLELPTTYVRPSPLSLAGLRVFPQRTVTATANTLRTDSRGCTGLRALRTVFERATSGVSMYMHPYDGTDYHGSLENSGRVFRRRAESLLQELEGDLRFVTASNLA